MVEECMERCRVGEIPYLDIVFSEMPDLLSIDFIMALVLDVGTLTKALEHHTGPDCCIGLSSRLAILEQFIFNIVPNWNNWFFHIVPILSTRQQPSVNQIFYTVLSSTLRHWLQPLSESASAVLLLSSSVYCQLSTAFNKWLWALQAD